jgi:NADH-quinone oxidoreductase subunit F
MDLHLMQAEATPDERAAVEAVLGPPETGWEGGRRSDLEGHVARGGLAARERRHLLLPGLHALQSGVGWISPGGMNHLCRRLSIPPADAYAVASFYAMLSTEPLPGVVVHVCDDIACRANGAAELCDELASKVGPPGTSGPKGVYTWARSPCLGLCERAPAALVQTSGREKAIADAIAPVEVGLLVDLVSERAATFSAGERSPVPHVDGDRSRFRLLRRIGAIDPSSLDDYREAGGYEALRKALDTGADGVIAEVKAAKLLGRGGAAFPTGVKWEAVAGQPARPHYFVCNADESEPGTFKDRVLMENDPFAVIEALTIAGFATGSERGYLYIRGEYPLAARSLQHGIEQARDAGLLGDDIIGSGFGFDIEIRRGAGAYIAGEETALFNSIEGKRPEPRNKPPFPVTHGLFGKPTGINNVETLVNVLEILRIGGAAYAKIGTPDSTGTRLFCLSGCVERPGVYEVEHGITLRELLELAGGVRGDRPLKAILLGGAAGSFLSPDDLDVRLSFEDAKAGGYTLGSGVVMVFDQSVDLVDIVLRIAAFFRDESCGQCVPCRVGTVRQEEALHRLAEGRPRGSVADELELIDEIARAMRDASICGLGQTAAGAVQSAIRRLGVFGDDGQGGHP